MIPVVSRFTLALLVLSVVSSRAAITHRWQFNETTGTNLADTVGAANASVFVLAGGTSFEIGRAHV